MKKFVLLVAVLMSIVACDDIEDACKEEKYASAIVYEFPDSLQAGVTHDLSIKYIVENSCGSFVKFEESVAGNEVKIKTKLLYEGCNCSLLFSEKEGFYPLKQDSVGEYTYRFWQGDSDFENFILKVYP